MGAGEAGGVDPKVRARAAQPDALELDPKDTGEAGEAQLRQAVR